IGHDRWSVLQEIADLTIQIASRVAEIGIPALTVVSERYIPFEQGVADGRELRGWQSVAPGVDGAVTQEPRNIIVDQIVVPRLAIRLRLAGQRIEIIDDRRNPGLRRVGAGHVRATRVAVL